MAGQQFSAEQIINKLRKQMWSERATHAHRGAAST